MKYFLYVFTMYLHLTDSAKNDWSQFKTEDAINLNKVLTQYVELEMFNPFKLINSAFMWVLT